MSSIRFPFGLFPIFLFSLLHVQTDSVYSFSLIVSAMSVTPKLPIRFRFYPTKSHGTPRSRFCDFRFYSFVKTPITKSSRDSPHPPRFRSKTTVFTPPPSEVSDEVVKPLRTRESLFTPLPPRLLLAVYRGKGDNIRTPAHNDVIDSVNTGLINYLRVGTSHSDFATCRSTNLPPSPPSPQ